MPPPDERVGESAFVTQMRADLEGYLRQLDDERHAVGRAIRALDGAASTGHATQESLRDAVLDAIGRDPGVRATMVALTLGHGHDAVTSLLRTLEQEGLAVRIGLGWKRPNDRKG